jgi:Ni,Fe-hydrogenase III component G
MAKEEILNEMLKRSKEVEKTIDDHIAWCEHQLLELTESGIHTKEEEATVNILQKEANFWKNCLFGKKAKVREIL